MWAGHIPSRDPRVTSVLRERVPTPPPSQRWHGGGDRRWSMVALRMGTRGHSSPFRHGERGPPAPRLLQGHSRGPETGGARGVAGKPGIFHPPGKQLLRAFSSEGLELKYIEASRNSTVRKQTTQFKNWVKALNRHVPQADIRIAGGRMKRCSVAHGRRWVRPTGGTRCVTVAVAEAERPGRVRRDTGAGPGAAGTAAGVQAFDSAPAPQPACSPGRGGRPPRTRACASRAALRGGRSAKTSISDCFSDLAL